MKDEFVSIVSHELRTPLTSIRGALGRWRRPRGRGPRKEGRHAGDRRVEHRPAGAAHQRHPRHRAHGVGEDPFLTRKLCSATALIASAVDSIRPIADKAGFALRSQPSEGALLADPDRMLQTLTQPHRQCHEVLAAGHDVSLSARSPKSGVVRFSVADQGRGIPGDRLETIFERFQQVDASDSRERAGPDWGCHLPHDRPPARWRDLGPEHSSRQGSRFVFTVPRIHR